MKGFSYILRHGILVAVVAGIAISYAYRQQLFPRFFEQEAVVKSDVKVADKQAATEAIVSSDPKSAQTVSTVESKAKASGTASSALTGVAPGPVEVLDSRQPAPVASRAGTSEPSPAVTGRPDSPAETAEQAKNTKADSKGVSGPARMMTGMMTDPVNAMSGMMKDPSQAMSSMVKTPAQTESDRPAVTANAQQARPAVPAAPATPGPVMGGMPATNVPQMSGQSMPPQAVSSINLERQYYQIINKARHAYWQGQYKESIENYEQAIKLLPDNPDSYGELGNVYYSQGEWDKSGESLYQSAIHLLEQKKPEKAYNLLSIIRGLKHERADELEKRLQALQSGVQ